MALYVPPTLGWLMQARSSSSGAMVTWKRTILQGPDWAGAAFPGPGSPLRIAANRHVAQSTPGVILLPAPIVTAITPNTGAGVAATSVVFVSSTKLTCDTPTGTAGPQDVVVTNPDMQTSGASGDGLFTYAAPPIIATLPLSLSLGAGTDLSLTPGSGGGGLPVVWTCRASGGTSATNCLYNGTLDGKNTLVIGQSGVTMQAEKSDLSGPRFADRIIAATDSNAVAAPEYTVWMLCRMPAGVLSGGATGNFWGRDGIAEGRILDSGGGVLNVKHDTWFGSDHAQAATPTEATWRVVWFQYDAANTLIKAATNDDAWTTHVNSLNSIPGGLDNPFLVGSMNGPRIEIADFGAMPGILSDADRTTVMSELRALYPSAGV